MPRVELGSEKKTIKTSTYIVYALKFHITPADRQALAMLFRKVHSKNPENSLNYLINYDASEVPMSGIL